MVVLCRDWADEGRYDDDGDGDGNGDGDGE